MGLYDTTIGTLLVGIFFNTFLYGLVTYQFALYYQMKFNDRPVLKFTVFFLFILDTFHTGSTIYMAWYYTVENFGNPAALQIGIWPYAFTPFGFAVAALITHMYLAIRIWRLTGSKFLYGTAVFLATTSFILGMITSVEGWIIRFLAELPRITPLVTAWLSVQVAVDTFITATLVITFARSRTGCYRTDTILNQLIRGAIQTGLFSSIFSLGTLIFFAVIPETNLYGMFAIPVGRVYTNTLLDTLITREILRVGRNGTADGTQSIVVDSLWWTPPIDSQALSTVQSTGAQPELRRVTDDVCDHSPAGDKVTPLKGLRWNPVYRSGSMGWDENKNVV